MAFVDWLAIARAQSRVARMMTLIRPREAGEGDHAERGGGGLGVDASLASQNNRPLRRPSHRANARSPSPLSRGGMKSERRKR
jgi:hypothetical protein